MKKFVLLFGISVIVISGCADKKKELDNEFETLLVQHDSIEIIRSEFKSMHKKMMAENEELKRMVQATGIKDSIVMRNLAQHKVIFKNHSAIIEGHDALVKGHTELRQKIKQEGLSSMELEAQFEEMFKAHEKLLREHIEMEGEHARIKKEYEKLHRELLAKQKKEQE